MKLRFEYFITVDDEARCADGKFRDYSHLSHKERIYSLECNAYDIFKDCVPKIIQINNDGTEIIIEEGVPL